MGIPVLASISCRCRTQRLRHLRRHLTMSGIGTTVRSAIVCSAIAILSLTSAQPAPAAAISSDDARSDLPAGILMTRTHLGDGPVVPQAANSAAGRSVVLAIRGFASIG